MQVAPVYDRSPLTIDGGPKVAPTLLRQRCRLLELVGSLTDEHWTTPSRCERWRVQDVVVHLASVDPYWVASINAGLAGEPTRFLSAFDPTETPAQLVEAAGPTSPAEALAELRSSTAALCDLVESLDGAGLSKVAESPVGHVAIRDVLRHVLWDAWIHERDVSLPIGVSPTQDQDEVAASLRYAAALSPLFAVMAGAATDASLLIEATDPDVRVVVSVTREHVWVHDGDTPADAVLLRGDAVELLEVLSARAPFDHTVPSDRRWLVRSLADAFES